MLDITSEAQPIWNATNSFFGKKWVWNLVSLPGFELHLLTCNSN